MLNYYYGGNNKCSAFTHHSHPVKFRDPLKKGKGSFKFFRKQQDCTSTYSCVSWEAVIRNLEGTFELLQEEVFNKVAVVRAKGSHYAEVKVRALYHHLRAGYISAWKVSTLCLLLFLYKKENLCERSLSGALCWSLQALELRPKNLISSFISPLHTWWDGNLIQGINSSE